METIVEDYLTPDMEAIVEKVLSGVVPDERIGTTRNEIAPIYNDYGHGPYDALEEVDNYDISEFDYIQVRRMLGYFSDSLTDMSGIEITTYAKDAQRAHYLMSEASKRILAAEGECVTARSMESEEEVEWLIDFVEVLNGPTENYQKVLDDRSVEKNFEIHVRVRWL